MLPIYLLIIYTDTLVYGTYWENIVVFPTFVKPERVKVLKGSSITVYCGSSSPVNWSFVPVQNIFSQSGHLTSLPKRHRQRNKSLTLFDLSLKDTGMYYCYGVHSNKKFVSPLYVSVNVSPNDGTVYPDWVEAPINGSVTLTCGSSAPVTWYSVHWRKLQKRVVNNSVTLFNLQKEHSGRYMCRGVKKLNSQDSRVANVFHSYAIIMVDSFVMFL